MTRNNDTMMPDLLADPFGERSPTLLREHLHLLGGRFRFESNSAQLLRLVDAAYAGLPRHRLSATVPDFNVRLLLGPPVRPHPRRSGRPPPPIAMFSGAGLVGGATSSSNFVIVSPHERAALVNVSPPMAQFSYHTRYELIEFAVFTLASRSLGLSSLHAACIGRGGRGILLMGPTGAGKSTVTLQCLLQGLDILSEDSVFVEPGSMLATGVPNFLHVRADSLRWLGQTSDATSIRKSPVIRRRSGVKKFEVDLRRGGYGLAATALKIVAIVFLSPQAAGKRPLLRPLTKSRMLAQLAGTQAYATNQPQWSSFRKSVSKLAAFELRRGRHPREAVAILRELLAPAAP